MADYEKYYQKSITALEELIEQKKRFPTEKYWNKVAGENGYLTSQSLSFISQMKFPELCKKVCKEE